MRKGPFGPFFVPLFSEALLQLIPSNRFAVHALALLVKSEKKGIFLRMKPTFTLLVLACLTTVSFFGQNSTARLTSENLSFFTLSVNGMRLASEASVMQEITGLEEGMSYNLLIDYVSPEFDDVRTTMKLNANGGRGAGMYSFTIPSFFQGELRLDNFMPTAQGQPGGMESMSMDMNVNMNVGQTALNVSFGNGGNAQPMSTPTPPAQTQQPDPAPATQEVQIVYVEGYSGAIGCERPVDDSRFERMMDKISDAGFSDDQVAMAKQILRTNCLKISQLVEILEEIAFDEGQLELAKFAYDHIYDLENYWEVYGVFSFSRSKEELEQFIDSQY